MSCLASCFCSPGYLDEVFPERIAKKGKESSEKRAQHRWVVERTLSWLNRYRGLKIRYEQRADIYQAFLHLGCALIWSFVQRLR